MTREMSVEGRRVRDRGTVDLDKEDFRLADGSRLTEQRAEEIVAEVLERTGRGRPSLSEAGSRSPQLRLSVPEELRTRLVRRAEDEHRSLSNVIREALEHYLAS
jgi:predicted HicB family RNase H-like nuclease